MTKLYLSERYGIAVPVEGLVPQLHEALVRYAEWLDNDGLAQVLRESPGAREFVLTLPRGVRLGADSADGDLRWWRPARDAQRLAARETF